LGLYDILEKRATIFEGTPISNPSQWLINLMGGGVSKTGIQVNEETAIKVAAVFACVNTISSDLSALPLHLKKTVERGSENDIYHPVYPLIHHLPNPETTAFEFWQMIWVNYLLTGYGYGYKKRNGAGNIVELWNIPTNAVQPFQNTQTGEKFYVVTDENGNRAKYYPEDIYCLRGMRFNRTDNVIKFIEVAREALGLSIAAEEFGARYFSNGAHLGGIVEYPGALNDDAFKRFNESFYEKYAGVVNAGKMMFLEGSRTGTSKYIPVGNDPEKSQMIETRKFQIQEVARFFNLPLYKVLDYEKSTFNNNEQQRIDYLTSCLNAHIVHNEQTIIRDLLLPNERKRRFAKYNVKGFLRGDTQAQKDFYNTMVQIGAFSPNNVLELEDMNGYEGGDIHVMNGTMMPVDKIYEIWKAKIEKGGNDNAGQINPGQGTTQ
jgi:HK97 family phage portal protein